MSFAYAMQSMDKHTNIAPTMMNGLRLPRARVHLSLNAPMSAVTNGLNQPRVTWFQTMDNELTLDNQSCGGEKQ